MTQPLLPCLLPSAKTYNTLRTTTNPYEATIAVKAAAAEAAGDAADKRKSRWAPDGKLLVMGTSGLFFSPLVPSFAARTCVGTAIDEDRPEARASGVAAAFTGARRFHRRLDSLAVPSGQNVEDIVKYSTLDGSLDILERLLEWRHLAPTAPGLPPPPSAASVSLDACCNRRREKSRTASRLSKPVDCLSGGHAGCGMHRHAGVLPAQGRGPLYHRRVSAHLLCGQPARVCRLHHHGHR